MKRDLLTLNDLTKDEILYLIDLAYKIKRGRLDVSNELRGKVLGMIFQKPSTRTRISFEVAMISMGGHSIYMGWDQLQLARGETIADTARVLSRYLDVLVARVFKHEDLEELARYASIPIINGLSDKYHPVQILSDFLTIYEKFKNFRDLKLAYIGDGGSNICHSLLLGCSKIGINISLGVPSKYMPLKDVLARARENAEYTGSSIEIYEEPVEAVKNANIIYTDTFVSMGFEEERADRISTFLPKYQVNKNLIRYAEENVIFMHCLPAHRGEEVTDEVIDGPQSVVWDQAENRMHMQKAILRWVVKGY